MRILFLESHPMLINGLPNGFKDVGCDVMISGPLTAERLSEMFSAFKPELVFTLGWSEENTGKKVDMIRSRVAAAGVPLVYWATEDPTHTHSFSLPLIQRLRPDFVFTICRQRVDYYRRLGIKAAHADFGFHPSIHFKRTPDEAYRCAVAVVANGYPYTLKKYPLHFRKQSLKEIIAPLVQAGIRVDFWGNNWDEMDLILGCGIPEEWLHGYLHYPLSNTVYNSADIILGLQNQLTQLSQRTYEILGSGGFLITSETPEVRRLFTPGEDLIVSSSPEHTLELVRHYAKNGDERKRISEQGHKSVAVHNYANRALYMMDILQSEKIVLSDTPGLSRQRIQEV